MPQSSDRSGNRNHTVEEQEKEREIRTFSATEDLVDRLFSSKEAVDLRLDRRRFLLVI